MNTKSLLLSAAVCIFATLSAAAQEFTIRDAKYKSGDDLRWSAIQSDDSDWQILDVTREWTHQGVKNENAYGWYRMSLVLPSEMKKADPLKKALVIDLGFVDDSDETFLNGKMVGKTGGMPSDPNGYDSKYNIRRRYLVNPSLIRWDKENVIAVRVYNGGDPGGMFGGPVKVRMADVADLVEISYSEDNGGRVLFRSDWGLKGELAAEGTDFETGEALKGGHCRITGKTAWLECPGDPLRQREWTVTFTESSSGLKAQKKFIPKYILTPKAPAAPRYNGPLVYGVRPGSPVIFRLPFSGERPMSFKAENLPEGIVIDAENGILSGSVKENGNYTITFVAENAHGTARQDFTLKVGRKIALTPPLGWNSWNCWGLSVSQEKVMSSAAAIIDKGLADYGYSYINIDDAWQADDRAPDGTIVPNEKFPDMKGLGEWLHSNGLKFGIYSSPGDLTCGKYLGSIWHEKQDAETYNEWGIDYLKYDWCGYSREFAKSADKSTAAYVRPYLKMEEYLRAQPRDIFYSLCQYGMADVWTWGPAVDANSWRTTGDITDTWESLYSIGFVQQAPLSPYAGPGHWNDPDMLIVGKLGWSDHLRDTRLTADEQYTHISLWALQAANLLIGCDVSQIDDFTVALLCNNEVNAVNQDQLGIQARQDIAEGDIRVWSRPLADGSTAVGIFNLSEETCIADTDLYLERLGLKGTVRDLWRQKDIESGEVHIAPHGVRLLKVSK